MRAVFNQGITRVTYFEAVLWRSPHSANFRMETHESPHREAQSRDFRIETHDRLHPVYEYDHCETSSDYKLFCQDYAGYAHKQSQQWPILW